MIRAFALAVLLVGSPVALADTEQEARDAGAAAAAVMSTLTETPAIEATPGYTASPPQTALGGSQAERDYAADAQAADCATMSSTTTGCEALNTVRADEAQRRAAPSMEDDPEVLGARSTGTATLDGVGLGYSACTPESRSVGTVTTDIQSCHDYYLRALDQSCSKVRHVDVSWSCNSGGQGPLTYPSGDYYCTREVTIYLPSCQPGEVLIGASYFARCRQADGTSRPAEMDTKTETVEEAAVPTVTETWDNACAGYEARVPAGLLPPDGINAVPTGGAATGRLDKCERATTVCSDEFPQSRFINRLWVTRQCWAYTNTFNCVNQDARSDCGQPRFGQCTPAGERCDDYDNFDTSICTLWTKDYSCVTSDTRRTETVMSCAAQTYTDNRATAWDTGYARNDDFAPVVSFMEAARQAGKYNLNQAEMFKGFDNRCRKKLFGLVNCCNRSGGPAAAFNNLSLALQLGRSGPSKWTFDGLFGSDSPTFVERGFSAITGGDFSALAGLFAGNFSAEGVISALAPSYWTLAVTAIAASGLLSCSEREKEVAMKRDARLCDYRGSYCSKKLGIIKTCIERTQTYCCFNSILAKLINRQGKAQLGQSPGDAKNPNCGGFSVGELQSLNLANMDFTEFYDSIEATPLNPAGTAARVDAADCYYGEGQCAGSRSTP